MKPNGRVLIDPIKPDIAVMLAVILPFGVDLDMEVKMHPPPKVKRDFGARA